MNWFLNMNLDLINSDWTLNTISDMNPLLWIAILNLWYDSEIHLCYMTFCMIWDLTLSLIPEPFLFPYLWRYHRHVCDAPLAWLMCGWVISHAVPFYDYYYGHYDFEYMTLRLTLSKGRMGCNPRHVCLVDLTMTLSWLWGDWYCVLYMPFTTPGSWSLHPYDTWGHPSYYLVAWEVSPLIVRL